MTQAHPARWLSFHLHANGGFDGFLTSALPGFLAAERARGSFRRFFFLRYSEGGPHLRLRFRIVPGSPGEALESRLEGWMAGQGQEARLETVPYDRGLHYFGETRASVYAELLNEATSWLALRLLATLDGQPRPRRWLVLAATLDWLTGALAADLGAKLDLLARSQAFAARVSEELLGPAASPALAEGRENAARWAAPLSAVRARLAPELARDRDTRRLTSLLRRTQRLGLQGGFVNLHALHLLCNKLGFSLLEEHAAFAALHGRPQ